MPNTDQFTELNGTLVQVSAKDLPPLTGKLRVVNHEIPHRGQSLNLEIPLSPGKTVTLQLTGTEARQLLATPTGRDRTFRWNGRSRSIRLVPPGDMLGLDAA